MDFCRVVRGRVNWSFYSRNFGLAAFLFAASLVGSCVSLYIPHFALKLSLRSLPMLLMGFWFGIPAGLINGAAVDLITFSWSHGLDYSLWFMVQSITIGVIGGLGRHLLRLNARSLFRYLMSVVAFFTLLYAVVFPSTIPLLLLYALCFYWLGLIYGKSLLALVILVLLSLTIYFASFGMGTLGAMSINIHHSPLLFFRARLWKELAKLFIFFPVCYWFLKGRYGSVR